MNLPVTAMIVTRNEAARLPACLSALSAFDDIVIIDSASTDNTAAIARAHGARVVPFLWNGRYPKKRQWCLENVPSKYDWIFFIDADEIMTPALQAEMHDIFSNVPACGGYFVPGRYIWSGRKLHYGLQNNKLVLFNRHQFSFPVVDDLALPGMGEMEGHYQPTPKEKTRIGQLRAALDHNAAQNAADWLARHERYATWERGMNKRRAWPKDPVHWRQCLKATFRVLPLRAGIAFLQCYIWKRGFLDGAAGLSFARHRAAYYRLITRKD